MKAHAMLVSKLIVSVVVAGITSLAGFRLLADPPNGIARVGTPKADAKCGAGLAKEEAVEHEKNSLVGVWKLVSCEAEGEKVPEEILRGEVVRWRFIDNTLTSTVNNEGKEEDKFTLDPKSNPKAIDLTDKNAHRTPGIYTLEGDTLKTCFDEGSDERPKAFATKSDTHLVVLVFKRERR